MIQFGVRCRTDNFLARGWTDGTICRLEDPVPITATFFPSIGTDSSHSAEFKKER